MPDFKNSRATSPAFRANVIKTADDLMRVAEEVFEDSSKVRELGGAKHLTKTGGPITLTGMAASARRILVIDDDSHYGPLVCRYLRQEGYAVEWAASGHAGLFKIQFLKPSLVLLDIHIPRLNGIALYKALRRAPQTKMIPILLISGLDVMEDLLQAAVDGLHAEPVFRKMDGLGVLMERVRQALRSATGSAPARENAPRPKTPPAASSASAREKHAPPIDLGGLRFYPDLRRVIVNGEAVRLNNKEAELFGLFISNPGALQRSERLWETAWPSSTAEGWRHTLDSRVSSLRKKLGEEWGARLVCQKNEGYVFILPT